MNGGGTLGPTMGIPEKTTVPSARRRLAWLSLVLLVTIATVAVGFLTGLLGLETIVVLAVIFGPLGLWWLVLVAGIGLMLFAERSRRSTPS